MCYWQLPIKDAFNFFYRKQTKKKLIIDRYVKLENVKCDLFDVSSKMLNRTYQVNVPIVSCCCCRLRSSSFTLLSTGSISQYLAPIFSVRERKGDNSMFGKKYKIIIQSCLDYKSSIIMNTNQ